MPDREKVIKEFADYVHYFKPYCIGDIEDHAMLKDALAMLKEQKAVKPKLNDPFYSCGNCGGRLWVAGQKHCASCGRAVKWDDI